MPLLNDNPTNFVGKWKSKIYNVRIAGKIVDTYKHYETHKNKSIKIIDMYRF